MLPKNMFNPKLRLISNILQFYKPLTIATIYIVLPMEIV